MPKTTSATVRLVLLKSARANKRWEYPIVLRIQYNGRAEKYTGISCKPSNWDSKLERINVTACKSSNNYALLNQTLYELKHKALTIRDLYEQKGIPYTAHDLLTDGRRDDALISHDMKLIDAVEMMVKVKGLSQNTAQAYRAAYRRIKPFVGEIILSAVDDVRMEGLCKAMKRSGYSDSTINVTMAMVKAVFAFLESKGVDIASPFRRFRYWKKYRINLKHRSVSREDMRLIMDDFVSRSVVADGIQGVWAYKDDAYKDLMNRNSELFAQCCFLLGYRLNGLAFCDLVRIKRENISVVEHGGHEYYVVEGLKRKKTNRLIKPIAVRKDLDTCVLFECFLNTMDMREGYFLPVLGGYGYDGDKQISEATGSCSVVVNKGIRKVFERLGMDSTDISYYCARHSFATHYIVHGKGKEVHLADLMGRSVSGIHRYVTGLTSLEQSIMEGDRMLD